MRALFTSDLHGDLDAYNRFASILRDCDYDIGIIAGDLTRYDLTIDEIASTPGIVSDDLLEELYDPNDTVDDLGQRISKYKKSRSTPLAKAALYKEKVIRGILLEAEKKIVIVPGNHDISTWKTGGNIHNVHNRSFKTNGYKFIGYRYTNLDVSEKQERRDIHNLINQVEPNTILVSHAPPFGILDEAADGSHLGSKALYGLYKEKNIVLHLFGHIHYSFGFNKKAANGSYVKGGRFIGINIDNEEFILV